MWGGARLQCLRIEECGWELWEEEVSVCAGYYEYIWEMADWEWVWRWKTGHWEYDELYWMYQFRKSFEHGRMP